jgi:pyrimidine deaminase RibD-like protein
LALNRRAISPSFSISAPNLSVRIACCLSVALRFFRIFLTDKGTDHILVAQERQFCELAVELAKKSIHENGGEFHLYVGAVVVKDGKIISTGFRGETGEGRHAAFCALKKLNEDVDHVDLSGCTVYTTLEPCSERKSGKTACATRLIKAKAARVVSGMPDKDKDVHGFSLLLEAGIHIGLFPNDLMQELSALNKEWSDTRRKPKVLSPPNDTSPIANASYYKPGTSMEDNLHLYVRPPKDAAKGFFTVENAKKNVLLTVEPLKKLPSSGAKLTLTSDRRKAGSPNSRRQQSTFAI